MSEKMLNLFNECVKNAKNNSDFCAITYTAYCGNCIEFDFFDHMITLLNDTDNNMVTVSYFNRPNMKCEYARMFDFNIELVDTITYSDNSIMVLFKYRDNLHRLVYDFDNHNMFVQLIDEFSGNVLDFDDNDGTFSTVYNNVVDEYDNNLHWLCDYIFESECD